LLIFELGFQCYASKGFIRVRKLAALGFALIVPVGEVLVRVNVEERNLVTKRGEGIAQASGKCRFTRATFGAGNGNDFTFFIHDVPRELEKRKPSGSRDDL
jgi:hypothetical protein